MSTHEQMEWNDPTSMCIETNSHLMIMSKEPINSYGRNDVAAKGCPKTSEVTITRETLVAGARQDPTMKTTSPFHSFHLEENVVLKEVVLISP